MPLAVPATGQCQCHSLTDSEWQARLPPTACSDVAHSGGARRRRRAAAGVRLERNCGVHGCERTSVVLISTVRASRRLGRRTCRSTYIQRVYTCTALHASGLHCTARFQVYSTHEPFCLPVGRRADPTSVPASVWRHWQASPRPTHIMHNLACIHAHTLAPTPVLSRWWWRTGCRAGGGRRRTSTR